MCYEKKTNSEIIGSLKAFLLLSVVPDKYKQYKGAFTRERKLPFSMLISLMIKALRKKIGVEITFFYERLVSLSLADEAESLTASGFCQSRQKLKPEFFQDGLHHFVDSFYTDNDGRVKLWHGKRLLAVDGSIIDLPYSKTLEEIYGTYHNQHQSLHIKAKISLLYDVLNEMVLDGRMGKYTDSERGLALFHLPRAQKGDIILYDRGYPSFDFIYQHQQKEIDFVMRTKVGWSNVVKDFVASGVVSGQVDLQVNRADSVVGKEYNHQTKLTVRLVRVELSTGEIEVLITSLLDEANFESAIFKELYFKRWGIETRYDVLKNTLQLEHFSGTSQVVIEQDFYITLLIANMEALLREEVNQQIKQKYKHRKHQYQVNISACVGLLREKITDLLLGKHPKQVLDYLTTVFAQHTEAVRPNRSFPRKYDKYKIKKVPKAVKNRKTNL